MPPLAGSSRPIGRVAITHDKSPAPPFANRYGAALAGRAADNGGVSPTSKVATMRDAIADQGGDPVVGTEMEPLGHLLPAVRRHALGNRPQGGQSFIDSALRKIAPWVRRNTGSCASVASA